MREGPRDVHAAEKLAQHPTKRTDLTQRRHDQRASDEEAMQRRHRTDRWVPGERENPTSRSYDALAGAHSDDERRSGEEGRTYGYRA